MHILVCDDDAAFAARMDEYISEWFRAREIQVQSTVCTSGEQLLATPELERYQLAFLDVDLKTTDGIALGRKLRQVAPDIVLVYISAYLEFAPAGLHGQRLPLPTQAGYCRPAAQLSGGYFFRHVRPPKNAGGAPQPYHQ